MRRLFGTRRGLLLKRSSSAPLPVISNIAVTLHGTYFIVTWTTDIASNSQVDYGLTSSYGSSTTLDASLVTSHSVQVGTVGSLSYNTLYHYRVKSSGKNSADQTTTTLSWPAGDDGALVGPTTIASDAPRNDYTTISGDITVARAGFDPICFIGCVGAWSGTVTNEGMFYGSNNTWNKTAPDGTALQYVLGDIQGGGGGGQSGASNPGSPGGGGQGGSFNGYEFGEGGYAGQIDDFESWGDGGSGGDMGSHGCYIYAKTKDGANFTPTFYARGTDGQNGTDGGDTSATDANYGGGGGGGGEGGRGGIVNAYYHGGSPVLNAVVTVGNGGSPGAGGVASGGVGYLNFDGQAGGYGGPLEDGEATLTSF